MKNYPYDPSYVYDKEKWQKGEWDSEIDNLEWKEPKTNYQCAIIRHNIGYLCGYVKIPPGNILHNIEKYTLIKVPEIWKKKLEDNEDMQEIRNLFFCHGGITYDQNKEEERWLGFDCGHSGDISPGSSRWEDSEYRNIKYVKESCERLATQIYEYEKIMKEEMKKNKIPNIKKLAKLFIKLNSEDARTYTQILRNAVSR